MDNGKNKELPSFWIPSLTPQAEKSKVVKPDSKVSCGMHLIANSNSVFFAKLEKLNSLSSNSISKKVDRV